MRLPPFASSVPRFGKGVQSKIPDLRSATQANEDRRELAGRNLKPLPFRLTVVEILAISFRAKSRPCPVNLRFERAGLLCRSVKNVYPRFTGKIEDAIYPI